MLHEGALNAALFLTFLQRLVPSARGKVFLIVDNLKVHKAGKVQAWVAAHRERIELFFLPAYAPEHNPDEFLHSDLKRSLGRRPAARDRAGLKSRLRVYLRRAAAPAGAGARLLPRADHPLCRLITPFIRRISKPPDRRWTERRPPRRKLGGPLPQRPRAAQPSSRASFSVRSSLLASLFTRSES
jgi:transposase